MTEPTDVATQQPLKTPPEAPIVATVAPSEPQNNYARAMAALDDLKTPGTAPDAAPEPPADAESAPAEPPETSPSPAPALKSSDVLTRSIERRRAERARQEQEAELNDPRVQALTALTSGNGDPLEALEKLGLPVDRLIAKALGSETEGDQEAKEKPENAFQEQLKATQERLERLETEKRHAEYRGEADTAFAQDTDGRWKELKSFDGDIGHVLAEFEVRAAEAGEDHSLESALDLLEAHLRGSVEERLEFAKARGYAPAAAAATATAPVQPPPPSLPAASGGAAEADWYGMSPVERAKKAVERLRQDAS